jgi:rhodanese-related sulfurtransferase
LPAPESGAVATAGSGITWGTGATANCVTDNLTGLMWAKNGVIGFKAASGNLLAQPTYNNTTNSYNQLTWSDASTAIGNLNTADTKLCNYNDWRLPTQKEILSLLNYAAVNGNQATWLNSQGFTNVYISYYCSSTAGGNGAWVVRMGFGSGSSFAVSSSYFVWPVRGGVQVTP